MRKSALLAAGFGIVALAILAAGCARGGATDAPAGAGGESSAGRSAMSSEKPPVVLSDEEWKKRLTAEQYRVARQAGTEAPHGAAYREFERQGSGTYFCVCCGAELFTSKEKFHSGCGWPSFFDAAKAGNVVEKVDHSLGMKRVEVVCRRCDGHLGHVFDGEGFKTPTDRRFCINAASMTFVPEGGAPPPLLDPQSDAVAAQKKAVAADAP